MAWQRSLKRPTEEQLTQSEFRLFCIGIKKELVGLEDCESYHDLQSALDFIVEQIREKSQEEDEKWNKLPENFQNAEIGELLESRRDALEEWAVGLEGVTIDEDEDIETIIEELLNIDISI